ncbi:MAG: WGR domain-containing protein [Myxococcales bacterium]|nr:WGR domain-containing protein [Myxococcales bacterium]
MSEDWAVYLTFTDSKSNKFWRARVDGDTLYVNYGRIGSSGQTQVKELGSTDACEKELDKLARSKRRKGYIDHVEGGGASAPAASVAATAAPTEAAATAAPAGPQVVDLTIDDGSRKVALRLACDSNTLRAVTVETFGSADAAARALARAKEALLADGYAAADHGESL